MKNQIVIRNNNNLTKVKWIWGSIPW
jgi:hypothetical protein